MPAFANIGPTAPRWATVSGPSFTLTLTGSNFIAGGRVYFGAEPLPTTVVDAGTVRATVPSSALTRVGQVGLLKA